MLLAHKIELRPTASQAEYLNKSCGSRRHCYNKLLEQFSKPENKWSKAAAYQHYIKVIRSEFPWYGEVSSRVTRNAIDDLDSAFKPFFRRPKTTRTIATTERLLLALISVSSRWLLPQTVKFFQPITN